MEFYLVSTSKAAIGGLRKVPITRRLAYDAMNQGGSGNELAGVEDLKKCRSKAHRELRGTERIEVINHR
jgi:hypothetical protein